MRHATLAALLAAALIAAGCGGDDAGTAPSAPSAPATGTIRIKDFVFDPGSATVKAGARISVANGDAAPHTLTDRPRTGRPAFDTGTIGGRQAGSFTASEPGTYEFHCELHAFMKGTLTVVA